MLVQQPTTLRSKKGDHGFRLFVVCVCALNVEWDENDFPFGSYAFLSSHWAISV